MQLAAGPGLAQLVRRHRDRRKGRGRLGLEEAEILGQLGRDQVAQGNIVDQHHQADQRQGRRGGDAQRHVVGDHRDLALQVAAPGLVHQRDRVVRRQKRVAAALVHQGLGPEAVGHFGAARLTDQLDVVHIGRAVGPLIGSGQRRGAIVLAKWLATGAPGLHLLGQGPQHGLAALPIVERGLHRRRDGRGAGAPSQIAGDHDQTAIAAAFQRSEFHTEPFAASLGASGWRSGAAAAKAGCALAA